MRVCHARWITLKGWHRQPLRHARERVHVAERRCAYRLWQDGLIEVQIMSGLRFGHPRAGVACRFAASPRSTVNVSA